MKKQIKRFIFLCSMVSFFGIAVFSYAFFAYKKRAQDCEMSFDHYKGVRISLPEDVDGAVREVDSHVEAVNEVLARLVLPETPMPASSFEFKMRLREQVEQWQELFHAKDVFFGFGDYVATEWLPQQELLGKLARYLQVSQICMRMLEQCGVNKIYLFERGIIEGEKAEGEVIRTQEKKDNHLNSYIFRLKFMSSLGSLKQMMNKMGAAEFPLIIRSLEVKYEDGVEVTMFLEYLSYERMNNA